MLILTKDLVPFIYVDSIRQGLTKGELSHHVEWCRTYQLPGAVKPAPILTKGLVTQHSRASGLHTTHTQNPGPLQDHHFCSNCVISFNKPILSRCRYKRKVEAVNFENICKTR